MVTIALRRVLDRISYLTFNGDDDITVDGTGNKTIDGGTGTDSLTINYSGLSSLSNFSTINVPTGSSSYISLTDTDGGVIKFKNIFTYNSSMKWDGYLTVGSKVYRFVSDWRSEKYPWEGAYGSVYAFIYQSGSNVEVVVPTDGLFNPNYRMSGYKDFNLNGSESYTITGSDGFEILKGGYQADIINAGSGDDSIAGGGGADTIDAGAGMTSFI